MKQIIALIGIIFVITGCSYHQPVPENYVGKVISIEDSVQMKSTSNGNFFYVKEYNDKLIENSHYKTLDMNYGRGFYMDPYIVDRDIPLEACKLKIVARTVYAAPILEITNTIYNVEGEIEFIPEANKSYYVDGELSEEYSAVWLAEYGTNKIIGKKFEVKGSSALGFFEK